jgi:hypothetical protein
MRTLENIALAKNHDGRMELFATLSAETGNDPYTVVHRWQKVPDGEWTEWKSLGEPDRVSAGYGPAVARNSDGRLEVVAGGIDGAAWHRWQRREGGWSDWHSFKKPPELQAVVASPPTLVYNGDARLELFTRGSDDAVWHRWQQRPSAGWSGWDPLEHPPEHPILTYPRVARNQDWRLQLFVYTDGAVWTRSQRAQGGWSGWESLEAPEGQEGFFDFWVVQNRSRALSVFFSNSNGTFVRRGGPTGGWMGWRTLEGPKSPSPVIVGAQADGRLVLFVVDATGALWRRDQRDPDWDYWRSLENPVPGGQLAAPTLALNAKGQLELWFTIRDSMDLYRLKQTTPQRHRMDRRSRLQQRAGLGQGQVTLQAKPQAEGTASPGSWPWRWTATCATLRVTQRSAACSPPPPE